MEYRQVTQGIFRSRPNRFIAEVELEGRAERVHVKNTGRCLELLKDGAQVYLTKSGNPNRKTAYDLIAVQKTGRLVNIDSYAPNLAAGEWLREGGLFPAPELIRAESTYGASRLDFYGEAAGTKFFVEVKGVTLERKGTALFPDAPSERAVKHVKELIRAAGEGYEACILFVVQMKGVRCFLPNEETQPAFGAVLREAAGAGVRILAYDCLVTEHGMRLADPVPVDLGEDR